jgi:hypothetical protein
MKKKLCKYTKYDIFIKEIDLFQKYENFNETLKKKSQEASQDSHEGQSKKRDSTRVHSLKPNSESLFYKFNELFKFVVTESVSKDIGIYPFNAIACKYLFLMFDLFV